MKFLHEPSATDSISCAADIPPCPSDYCECDGGMIVCPTETCILEACGPANACGANCPPNMVCLAYVPVKGPV